MVQQVLSEIKDPLLHLAMHIAFVCSLRAVEVAGIECASIDFRDRSILHELPKEEIIKIFPKSSQRPGAA